MAVGDWTLPNRSVRGWVGAELDETGALAEKAFQSPNSPFPFDDVAAGHKRVVICLDAAKISVILTGNALLLHCYLNRHLFS